MEKYQLKNSNITNVTKIKSADQLIKNKVVFSDNLHSFATVQTVQSNKISLHNSNRKNLLKNMLFPSIIQSPLDNLYNSVNLEKEMRKELQKKGLNIKDTSAHALNNKNALRLKVKRVKIYEQILRRFKVTNKSEFYSYLISKDILIKKFLNREVENLNIEPLKSGNSPQKGLNIKKGKKNVNSLPTLMYYYPNISLNDSKEGILNNRIINYNKYIKNLTSFNAGIAANQTIAFKFIDKIKISIKNLYKLLLSSLNPTKALISQPNINESANKIEINLFLYLYASANAARKTKKFFNSYATKKIKNKFLKIKNLNPSFIKSNDKRLKHLCENLSQIFKKRLSLGLTRLYRPTLDSQILSTAMGSITKKNKFNKIKGRILKGSKIVNPSRIIDQTLFNYNSLYDTKNINPANLSGISVRVAGRLVTEKVVPRKTVRSFQIGSLARSKANIVKTDRYTKKNKRGCFSVTVKTGHFIN